MDDLAKAKREALMKRLAKIIFFRTASISLAHDL
jgi:hypothetical protein